MSAYLVISIFVLAAAGLIWLANKLSGEKFYQLIDSRYDRYHKKNSAGSGTNADAAEN